MNFYLYKVAFFDETAGDFGRVINERGVVIGNTISDAMNHLYYYYGETSILGAEITIADADFTDIMPEGDFPETIKGAMKDWDKFIDNYNED